MTEVIYKFDSWPSIFKWEENAMLSESKKQISQHYWHQVQHSARGGVTKLEVWMGHYHDLYNHNKHPSSLAISLEDMILPVVRSQGYMQKDPTAGITQQNQ